MCVGLLSARECCTACRRRGEAALLLLTREAKSCAAKISAEKTRSMESWLKGPNDISSMLFICGQDKE